ncbi:MAG: arsenical resistance operon transcriptional repressor ArsD [Verrucomicrobiaceae bacterium]|nr:MAG: arsenical resistance operon transcriptional repressor ArsD [Verrucomicrobiaceae bacterium]
MKTPPFKLLFLCTGNSARSILAEYLARSLGGGRFEVFSAGSLPKPAPHPLALKVLQEHFQLKTAGARSKSWEEFEGVKFDFVITLCDSAKEICPVWPGQPVIAHWGSPDPAEADGEDAEKLFWNVAQQIKRRIELFYSLPFEKLDALRLEHAVRDIGNQEIMKTIQVYDPPMCCSSGVCGTDVDPELAAFAGFLEKLSGKAEVRRYNLGQQPLPFVENPVVKGLLDSEGADALPVVIVDGAVLCKGRYPDAAEQAVLLGA